MTANEELPSHMRSVPGSVNIASARFPSVTQVKAADVNASAAAGQVIDALNKALESKDLEAVTQLFVEEGYWRDHLALTWKFRTLHTRAKILEFLKSSAESRDGFRLKKITVDDSTKVREPKVAPLDAEGKVPGIQFFGTVDTVLGNGTVFAQLVNSNGEWKIFTLYTKLEELTGFEEPSRSLRPKGVQHGGRPGRKNWVERRQAAVNFEDGSEPAVVVVGGGQAGLTAAARLKMLGVETLVIDQNERVGDNWRKRYHQLVLHDPVWYDHLPYLQFPAHWPIFTPKDKLGEFFEAYAKILELNVWTSTELVYTKYDDNGKWTVIVKRKMPDGSVDVRTFHPRHVIQATGHSGKKNQPHMPGVENFKGDRLCHSSEFPGAQENSQGKKAIVVGSCNSAHDIAQDYLEKGYEITIVQRSSTHVVSSESLTSIGLFPVYSENGPPVDDGDMLIHGTPSAVLKANQVKVAATEADNDREILDALAKVGFKTDMGPDDAGFFFKYFQRGGGYYIDVGASRLVADGKIKIKQGQGIKEVLPNGLRFTDDTELEADEIILATGYQNMRTQTRLMFGDEIADRVGDVWGFNEEGELRTMWQDSGLPGFWFHGGNLALCRFYSRLLALQIKGLEEGLYKPGET